MTQSSNRRLIQVVEYNPEWPKQFCQLRDRIWPYVRDRAIAIEHVGSTSVPGLAAKPVIDIDIVLSSHTVLPQIVEALASLGYEHRGDLGIQDRTAFAATNDQPAHHLYACPRGTLALGNHLTLRDHLRDHAADAMAYSRLKRQLAEEFPHDIVRYIEGKSQFILSILAQYGLSKNDRDSIEKVNRSKSLEG